MEKRNRRKFLFAGLSLAAMAAAFRFVKRPNEKKPSPTSPPARFLTQDGRLVEIEIDKIPTAKKAANKQDIQTWVNKNKPL